MLDDFERDAAAEELVYREAATEAAADDRVQLAAPAVAAAADELVYREAEFHAAADDWLKLTSDLDEAAASELDELDHALAEAA